MIDEMSDTMVYDDEKIRKIVELYKKSRARDKVKYDKKKDDPNHKEENKLRCKAHYLKVKDAKKLEYANNREFRKHRSLFNYYRLNDRVEEFISKYPERVTFLDNHGVKVRA